MTRSAVVCLPPSQVWIDKLSQLFWFGGYREHPAIVEGKEHLDTHKQLCNLFVVILMGAWMNQQLENPLRQCGGDLGEKVSRAIVV
ncbi:hypothetical protein CfE428DRAFT_1437 [Chthoniobacter flavus Ellin428]|uniref:Uncharacterized protein n=1 Tax=Chthoniobacter flavus Ellin428 TaxID=497964 RepID=B4CXZ6_9BACT|nr:hypothetical protein CfE428DRAFT_1437 [Chthoniobacter flavus Ellin428]TCO87516.1 hypothetical protein EV701_12118 [Chthoniobacter flavus]